MSDLMLDVGLANELKMSFRRNHWTEELVKKATEGDFLAQVRRVLLGHAEIITPEHMIDLDADPYVPDGWSVEEHQKGGQFAWDPSKVSLYPSKKQQNDKWIEGYKLRKKLATKTPFNANLLDYLLAHPYLIPEEWKGKIVSFWGTIYRVQPGLLHVRYLGWRGDRWHWDALWRDRDRFGYVPAAVPAPEVQLRRTAKLPTR